MSSQPTLNQPFPAFSLPAAIPGEAGSTETTLNNASFAGKPFVLFVYPRDNTPGCTIEANGFSEYYAEFQAAGIAVAGISRDSVRSHCGFIKKQGLPYPLLADDGGSLLNEWGLISEGSMYGKPVTRVARTTYLIDGAGVIRQIWEKVSPPGHAQAVLEAARQLAAA